MRTSAGGGSGSLIVDHGTLAEVSSGLASAGTELDSCGNTVPQDGDLGLAGPLLAGMMARTTEIGARISFEAQTLATVVAECNDSAADTDRAVAESYLVGGS